MESKKLARDARGRKQYRYHTRYREVRDGTKFAPCVGTPAAFMGGVTGQLYSQFALTIAVAVVKILYTEPAPRFTGS